jgi:nucleoside-diphosphate-sugar epimerase
MKVLVTGGAGYIGTAVVAELLSRDHGVRIVDVLNWGRGPLEDLEGEVEIRRVDIRNSRDVIYALEGIDAVVHLAGIVGEAACNENHKANFSVNIEGTRTLLNCCTDPEVDLVRDFIYISSCSVYGNVHGLFDIVTEDAPLSPLTSYAYGKVRSEEIVLQRAATVPHFHPTVLRLTTLFGWAPRLRLDLVTNLFTYKAWRHGVVTVHGDGCQYRSLIHVRDVAAAIADTLEAPRFMRSGKVFHVGDESNNMTVNEIAARVCRGLPSSKVVREEAISADRRDYRISCQRIVNNIGWRAHWTVDEGIRELMEKFDTQDCDWDDGRFRNSEFKYY